jgi:protein-tyrosine phosphatase
MDTTLRMIRTAVEQGVTTICCTPHMYDYDRNLVEETRAVYQQTVAAVAAAGLPVTLLQGFEVDLLVAATSDPATVRSLCIQTPDGEGAKTAAMIVEMPYNNWPPFFEESIYKLATAGVIPIIAHPERNERVQRSPDVLLGCMNAGAILQGTSGSFTDLFRRGSQKTFLELLARGWFSLLASDAHSEPDYTWSLGPLMAELGDRLSPEDRTLLVNVNPARILEGKRPLPLVPKQQAKGRRFFGRRSD